jgi:flavorubredoxin
MDFDRDWMDEARRYYTNIVGKYGPQVQALLKKLAKADVKFICPLHGPVWRSNLPRYLEKYDKWSRYEPEEKGVLIVYGSMYGNTESAAGALATTLAEKSMTNVVMYDVSNTHVSYLISDTFRFSHLVLASATYNLGIYPPMHNYLMDMKGLNLQKRTCAIVENGSWACRSGALMRDFLGNEMKQMTVLEEKLTLTSSMNEGNIPQMEALADSIIASME